MALSGDFRKADGTPAYPMFDLAPLTATPGVEYAYVDAVDGVMQAADLAGFDALILLAQRFDERSIPAGDRLAVVARFGVGYDNVDVHACTEAGIALVITPDGVRRPVAVTVLTFMFALAGKLMIKDRLTRQGPAGWAQRSAHMGMGLTGRTLGQLGIGNIGSEVFRIAAPLGMRFIAHDPFVTAEQAKALNVELVDLDTLFRKADFLSISVPLNDATKGIVGKRLLGLMKPTAYLINTARGPDCGPGGADRGAGERHDRGRRAGRLRGRAGAGRRAASETRQRDRHAARAVLDGRVLCRQWRSRRGGRPRPASRS